MEVGTILSDYKSSIFTKTLNQAIEKSLRNNKSPSRKVCELDNRGSHFYLALYWAEALSLQTDDNELSIRFIEIAKLRDSLVSEMEIKNDSV